MAYQEDKNLLRRFQRLFARLEWEPGADMLFSKNYIFIILNVLSQDIMKWNGIGALEAPCSVLLLQWRDQGKITKRR